MASPYLAEIRIISFNFAPRGWAFCNGQLLLISQNQALFALLGTTYGGNGTTNFALPNLQGRVPFHFGQGFSLGQSGGEISHTLTTSEMPAHNHLAMASSNNADQVSPGGNFWAKGAASAYSAAANSAMSPASLANAGGSQPHANMSPFLTLNFVIALQGIFPSRN
jgi:microcystin-dependent protein